MKKSFRIFPVLMAVTLWLSSCTTDKNAPGVEYMPDMYRSPALEAYIDYGNNKTMDWIEEQKTEGGITRVYSMKPPAGTIAYAGQTGAIFNMPYPLANTPEDYERAALEIHSPIVSNKENIENGIAIYTKMCTHCHGPEGHGDGAISKNPNGIAGIPDYATKLKDLPEGKMYHTIQYGKGLMGSHASQLNQKERWQVIEYVKLLQKGITTPEFNAQGMLVLPEATAAPADTALTK
jgi:mono/diheme cytochrome c family protein